LSHHLVSDEEAFRFLRELFTEAAQSPVVRWRTPDEVLSL
jgi:hypothetical protein